MPTEEEIAAAKAADEQKAKDDAAKAAAEAEEAELKRLGEKGIEALREERQRAKDAEAARIAAEKERDDLRKQAADAAAAKAKADEEAAEKRGEFEELAKKRGDQLTTLTEERDALAKRVQAYEDRDRKQIDEGIKALPDDLKEFDPGPDAPLDQRMTWFSKSRDIAAKRTGEQAKDAKRDQFRSVAGAAPVHNGAAGHDDQQARADMRRTVTREF